MTYAHDLGNGQRLLVQNEGNDKKVALSSGDSGQQQNQSTGFSTGEWSKPPGAVFASPKNLSCVLRVRVAAEVHQHSR